MNVAAALSPEPLLDLFLTDIKVLSVKTGLTLGVFDAPVAVEGTAWDAGGARRLLDVLVTLGLLYKEAGSYRPTPIAQRYLAKDGIGGFFLNHTPNEGHRVLADAIRLGKRPVCHSLTGGDSAALWDGWAAMKRTLPTPAGVWTELGVTPREGLRVLDVACGAARFTLELARSHPGVLLWLQDWLEVLDGVRSNADDVPGQIHFIPGGIDAVDFGRERFDIAWIGHILHYFGERQVIGILTRVQAALAPGGLAVLHEDIPNGDRTGDEYALLESLWMYMVSEGGDVRTLAEWRSILEAAGFAAIEQIGDDLIRARKC